MKCLCDWDKICLPAVGKIQNNEKIIEIIVITKPTMLKEEIVYYEVDHPIGYKIINLNNLYSIEGYEPEKDYNNNISIQS
jgi:hypothetical protein